MVTTGCGKRKAEPAKEALVDQLSAYGGPETAKLRGGKAAEKAAETAKTAEIPGAVRGTGWHIPWYALDPKHPNLPPQRLLVADAERGALDSDNDIARARLTNVHATLYHQGKPSATLVAPHVTANERDRVLVATGGVTIHSLLDPTTTNKQRSKHSDTPANTTVTADKVVWDSHTTAVVCTGNARLVSKRPGSPDVETYSEKIIYDTETGETTFRFKPQ